MQHVDFFLLLQCYLAVGKIALHSTVHYRKCPKKKVDHIHTEQQPH